MLAESFNNNNNFVGIVNTNYISYNMSKNLFSVATGIQ